MNINPTAILLGFLQTQTPLTTRVQTRLWERRFNPLPGYDPTDGNAICFRRRGGQGLNYSYTGAIYHSSWMFKCYGIDEADAESLYLTLLSVLNEKMTGGMYRAWEEIAGQPMEERPLGWHYNLCYFETLMLADFVPA